MFEKLKKSIQWFYLITVLAFFLLSFPSLVKADSWWGYGYRSADWVLNNGGTIIRYKISGSSASDRYKAVLYQNGKYVEVEFGKSGKFDDAKSGLYTVSFYKGGIGSETTYKGGKFLGSINITASNGKKIELVFSETAKTTQITTTFPFRKAKPEPDLSGKFTSLINLSENEKASIEVISDLLKSELSPEEWKNIFIFDTMTQKS